MLSVALATRSRNGRVRINVSAIDGRITAALPAKRRRRIRWKIEGKAGENSGDLKSGGELVATSQITPNPFILR